MNTEAQNSNDKLGSNEQETALSLRFSFSNDAPFAKVYRSVQDAGWTFNGQKYYDKNEPKSHRQLLTAAQVLERLDYAGVPDVYSELQEVDVDVQISTGREGVDDRNKNSFDSDESTSEVSKNDYQSFRQQVWNHYYQRFLVKELKSDTEDTTDSKNVTSKLSKRISASKNNTKATARVERPASRPKRTVTVMERGSDLYLTKRAPKKSKKAVNAVVDFWTSDTEKLQRPSLDECCALVENAGAQLPSVEDCLTENSHRLEQWKLALSTNHNVLLYGAGSKREVLDHFLSTFQGRANTNSLDAGSTTAIVLTLEGSDPDCTVTNLINVLVDNFLPDGEPSMTTSKTRCDIFPDVPMVGRHTPWYSHDEVTERAISVGRHLAHELDQCICIGVHNFDMSPLVNTPRAQQALSLLLSNSVVSNGTAALRLIATVNQADAPHLLWSSSTAARFHWSYQLVTTNAPFGRVELQTLGNKIVSLSSLSASASSKPQQRRDARTAAQVVFVLQNIAPRHAEVVQILARLQLQKLAANTSKHNQQVWIPYKDYFQACKNGCAVTKDAQLRGFLTELVDHELVEQHRQRVRVPYAATKLEDIVRLTLK